MLQNSLICSMVILFVFTAFQYDNIFDMIGMWLELNLPELLYKPLIGCLPCMGFWYGLGVGLYLYGICFQSLIFAGTVAGINALLASWLSISEWIKSDE